MHPLAEPLAHLSEDDLSCFLVDVLVDPLVDALVDVLVDAVIDASVGVLK